MNELEATFRDFRICARKLGAYEKIPLDELANKYCEATDNNNEYERNIYFSAIVLRFWYKISKLRAENPTLNLEYADYLNWVVSAILMACEPEARTWQKNTKLNANQVINQILATRFVAAAYYDANLQKNQGKRMTGSLDDPVTGEDDDLTVGATIQDEDSLPEKFTDNAYYWIQEYLNKNKIVEAIILDTIAHKDVYKHSKKVVKQTNRDNEPANYVEYSSTFWPYKLVKELSSLNTDYISYFTTTYSVSKKAFEAAFAAVAKATNQKRYRMVASTLKDFKGYIEGVA